MPGRHLPADREAGDESTLGGYMAIHRRPAAFDGPDGLPYTVDVATDSTGDTRRPFAAFLLFLRWRRIGEPGVDAYLESEFIAFGATPDEARTAIGALSLHEVKATLDRLVQARTAPGARRWWDAMREEDVPG